MNKMKHPSPPARIMQKYDPHQMINGQCPYATEGSDPSFHSEAAFASVA